MRNIYTFFIIFLLKEAISTITLANTISLLYQIPCQIALSLTKIRYLQWPSL